MKITTKTIHEVDVFDFDLFVEQTYGFNPETVTSEEASNDSTLSFDGIDGKLDEWGTDKVENFLKGEFVSFATRSLLNKLCQEGKIPAGDYLIKVSW